MGSAEENSKNKFFVAYIFAIGVVIVVVFVAVFAGMSHSTDLMEASVDETFSSRFSQ